MPLTQVNLQQPRQLGPQTIPQLLQMIMQRKIQERGMGLEERKMTLEEMVGQARAGAYERQEVPEPPLEQLQKELQYWQGVYGRTYEKGMLGGWGEIADPQTKKMAEARISQIGKRIVEILSGQTAPRKRVESREVLPTKPALSPKITPKTMPELSKDFDTDLANGLNAVKRGANPHDVFYRLGAVYKHPSKEFDALYKALLPLMRKIPKGTLPLRKK